MHTLLEQKEMMKLDKKKIKLKMKGTTNTR